jgi:hypothetical protein
MRKAFIQSATIFIYPYYETIPNPSRPGPPNIHGPDPGGAYVCFNNNNVMELNGRMIGSFEIVRYHFQTIDGQPKIVIEMIKVLDTDGKYIKFAKLEKVQKYLSQFPVKFKPLEQLT